MQQNDRTLADGLGKQSRDRSRAKAAPVLSPRFSTRVE